MHIQILTRHEVKRRYAHPLARAFTGVIAADRASLDVEEEMRRTAPNLRTLRRTRSELHIRGCEAATTEKTRL